MKSLASWMAAAVLVCGFSATGRSADLVVTKAHAYRYDVCLALARRDGQKTIAIAELHPMLKTGDPAVNEQAEKLRDERRAIHNEEHEERCI